MDLLKRRLLRTAAFLAAPSVVVACLWSGGTPEPTRPAFPHSKHGEEAGLSCESCHRDALTGDPAGMPSEAQCRLCHRDLDQDKPLERQSGAFFNEGEPIGPSFTALSKEVVFSHRLHVSDEHLACSVCHGDLEHSDAVTADVHVDMKKCVTCHVRDPAMAASWANDCAVCHREIRVDQAPADHAADWIRQHGRTVRREGDADAANCTMCHARSACQTCHHTELPADHTNYWRQRGHGVAVAVDRDRCSTCHQADACERCHSQTAPLSHTAGWGSPMDRHCVTCHLPLGSGTGCTTCHRSTPSHAQAPPMPTGHNPAMNCRQCHGHGAPLTHPDKGDLCTACHK